MSVVLLVSIAVRLAALALSLVVLRRIRDWRIAVITAMIALMALRQILTALDAHEIWPLTAWNAHLQELPGLGVSVLALLSVLFFGRLMQEQIRDREAAEEAGAKLTAIIDTAVSAIITSDEEGTIEDFNPAAERMFGYGKDECIGRNVRELMPEPYRSGHDAFMHRYLTGGAPRIIGLGREVAALRKDGSVVPVHLSVSEVELPDRRLFTAMVEDISARKEAERRISELQRELIHVARLSAMGELSSALAHELNQPLTAISNYAETARRLLEQSGTKGNVRAASDLLVKAGEQALRAGEIVRRVREFIIWGEAERSWENLPETVEEATKLAFVGTSAKAVDFALEAKEDLPKVLIDRIQIQQVIQNLVRNAVDALEGWDGEKRVMVRIERAADEEVAITVEDTGPGLDEQVKAQLFEPFVTTKREGMGIGLSVCRNIVEAHGGWISGENVRGGGARFRVVLPIKQKDLE